MMKKILTINPKILLGILSACMLTLSWSTFESFTALLFFGLVPLLFLWKNSDNSWQIFKNVFFAFFLWNLLTTYWIWNASPIGMIAAIFLNAFLMSLPFYFSFGIKEKFSEKLGLISLVIFWLSYEYFHMTWELSWPWLTLGNGLSEQVTWIQWYEYTGVFGGSLWILLVNIFLFIWVDEIAKVPISQFKKIKLTSFFHVLFILFVPILLSKLIYSNYKIINSPCKVSVIQPNVDPYSEKFDINTRAIQLEKLIQLSTSVGQKNTEFFIWPETALQDIYEDQLIGNDQIVKVKNFLSTYKNGNIITGISGYLQYNSKKTETARTFSDGGCCYDAFNSALQIENSNHFQIYHKSKLVPGVEKMPYPKLFSFLEPFAINLGGTFGSLGTQEKRSVFYSQFGIGVAPVICYESIYGEFIAEYIKNGAQFIAIVTNDGWWGNTAGYKQHFSYARLRAIETRRDVARSANTGISGFINQKGDVVIQSEYWKEAALSSSINLNEKITFYVGYGDYIARAALFGAIIFLFLYVVKKLKK